jgi:hypothetical protein
MAMDGQNRPQGTGFTNLQQYLQANKPGQVAGAVSQGLQKDTQQAQNQIGQQQSQFNQQAQAGQLGNAQDVQQEKDILGKVDNAGSGDVNAQDVSAYSRLRSGAYGGPQGLSNAQGIQNKAADVQGAGAALGTQGGRFGLLQRYLGQGKQYTTGQQGLDATLMSSGGGQQLAQAAQGTVGLQQQATNAANTAQQQAQTYTGQAQAFGQQATGAINQRQTGLTNQLAQTQQQDAANQAAAYQQQQGQLSQDQLTAQMAQQLGLQQGQSLYDLNLGQFATQAAGPTTSSVATQADLAKANALSQLAGQQGGQNIIADQSQVGTYDPNKALNFDTQGFQSALQNRQGILQQHVQQQQSDIMNNPKNGIADYLLHQLSPTGGDYNRLRDSGLTMQQLITGIRSGDPNVLGKISTATAYSSKAGNAYGLIGGGPSNPGGINAKNPQDLADQLQNALNGYLNAIPGQVQQQLGYTQTANILPNQGQGQGQ